MLKTVRLYGHLGKTFGKTFKFDVKTPAEAVAALKATVPGFTEYMIQHSAPGYHVFTGKTNLGAEQLAYPAENVIKIVPVVSGAGGNGGFLQTILGIVLIVVGVWFNQPWLINIGISLTLGGIAQMLFAPPKPTAPEDRERSENKPSYAFDGPVNTSQQGNVVPVGYGRMIIGGQVITAGMYVESI